MPALSRSHPVRYIQLLKWNSIKGITTMKKLAHNSERNREEADT
jgi:hypothetical protein